MIKISLVPVKAKVRAVVTQAQHINITGEYGNIVQLPSGSIIFDGDNCVNLLDNIHLAKSIRIKHDDPASEVIFTPPVGEEANDAIMVDGNVMAYMKEVVIAYEERLTKLLAGDVLTTENDDKLTVVLVDPSFVVTVDESGIPSVFTANSSVSTCGRSRLVPECILFTE